MKHLFVYNLGKPPVLGSLKNPEKIYFLIITIFIIISFPLEIMGIVSQDYGDWKVPQYTICRKADGVIQAKSKGLSMKETSGVCPMRILMIEGRRNVSIQEQRVNPPFLHLLVLFRHRMGKMFTHNAEGDLYSSLQSQVLISSRQTQIIFIRYVTIPYPNQADT